MLESIQRQFCQSLFVPEPNLDFIESDNAADRFAIYRHTIQENLRHALELTFPGIWVLLGCDCANGAAYLFIKQAENFPTTGCLDDWGEGFPAFLATIEELKSLPYLSDFAKFEWLNHVAYGAKDETVLKAKDLQKITEDTVFIFHPSVCFFASSYPIHHIQDLIKNPDQSEISLDTGGCQAIILRVDYCVTICWLAKPDWQFLFSLSQGYHLEKAYEEIMATYSDFDLVKNLHFMMKNEIIHQIKGS